jgi:hypothetical protein
VAASVYSRTFQKASELLGGHAKLCRHLRVPLTDLEKWIADKGVPPIGIFLRAVDLILQETPAPPSDTGSDDPAAPRDCSSSGDSSATRY